MSLLSGKRILIVEDEALIAAMVEDALAQLGAVVIGPAATIAQGLALAETETIDAALLDVNIRDQLIEPVAARLKERGIPILFATGYGTDFSTELESANVIDKPYSQEKLENALTQVLAAAA